MERSHLLTVGGVCAVLYTVAVVVALALLASTDLLDAEDATDVLPILVEDKTVVVIAGCLFILAPILLAVSGLALAEALSKAGEMMRLALLALLGGSLLALIRNVSWLALTYELAPAYADASADAQSTLAAEGDTWITFGYILGDMIGGVLVAGVAVALFSAAILRTGFAPRWVGWLGFPVALLAGWLTLLGPAAEAFEAISFIGFVAFWVWMIAMGVTLMRRSSALEAV